MDVVSLTFLHICSFYYKYLKETKVDYILNDLIQTKLKFLTEDRHPREVSSKSKNKYMKNKVLGS
jgi:hypothetical protein